MNSELARLAKSQYGLFTTRQALDAGYRIREQRRGACAGRWRQVIRGVWVCQDLDPTLEQRCRALTLIGAGSFVISGRAALALRGIESARPVKEISVVVPPASGVLARAGVVYRRYEVEHTEWRGITLACTAQAAIEIARFEPIGASVPILDELLRRKAVTEDELRTLISELASGARGKRNAARALEYSDASAESAQESRLRLILVGAQIPGLVSQFEVRDERGKFVARCDFAIPMLRIAIEYDGVRYHRDDHERFVSDRRRQNALVTRGWTVIRFTKGDLVRPEWVIQSVIDAIKTAST